MSDICTSLHHRRIRHCCCIISVSWALSWLRAGKKKGRKEARKNRLINGMHQSLWKNSGVTEPRLFWMHFIKISLCEMYDDQEMPHSAGYVHRDHLSQIIDLPCAFSLQDTPIFVALIC
jgi:hypothetical protein